MRKDAAKRGMRAGLLAVVCAASIPGRVWSDDKFHPFRDFGKNTAAPPGQTAAPASTLGSVSTPADLGDGHADAHPYHPFRDFGRVDPTPPQAAVGALVTPAAPIAPFGDQQKANQATEAAEQKEPWPDATPWEKKTEKEALEDATSNFENVIETYLARVNNADGCWIYQERGKTMCLKLLAIDGAHAKKVGAGLYSAVAAMTDMRSKARPALRFTVDFSDPEWSVVSVKRLDHPRAKSP